MPQEKCRYVTIIIINIIITIIIVIIIIIMIIYAWLMEPGGLMPYLQGLFNNPYPEPNQPNFRIDKYLFNIHSNK